MPKKQQKHMMAMPKRMAMPKDPHTTATPSGYSAPWGTGRGRKSVSIGRGNGPRRKKK